MVSAEPDSLSISPDELEGAGVGCCQGSRPLPQGNLAHGNIVVDHKGSTLKTSPPVQSIAVPAAASEKTGNFSGNSAVPHRPFNKSLGDMRNHLLNNLAAHSAMKPRGKPFHQKCDAQVHAYKLWCWYRMGEA